mgnify:CR=1 FL=1
MKFLLNILHDDSLITGTDDYPCPNNVPYSFPVAIAGITECSTYAVVSRLKSSPAYNITVSGGTFVHPGYPQVTITVPQEAVANETRLSLQLKVGCHLTTIFINVVVNVYGDGTAGIKGAQEVA